MIDLEDIRKNIDNIDREMTKLFEKRMELVLNVAKYKEENNQKIFDSEREKKVIEKNKGYLENKEYEKSLEDFYTDLMTGSRKFQAKQIYSNYKDNDKKSTIDNIVENSKEEIKNPKVCYQGVPGAYGEEALIKVFGKDVDSIYVKEFEDVFKKLKNKDTDYGILPIENSSTGSIVEVYDLLKEYGYYIVDETSIKVDQNLLSLKDAELEDINQVYSHPQGLQQSSDFLKKYNWEQIPLSNTAESAKYIRDMQEKSKTAIASLRAAEIYNLKVLQPKINYNRNNSTRFIVIGKSLELRNSANKISVIFSAPHKPGALYGALSYFAENNLNMLRIESRPVVKKSWEYFFYIDFEGNLHNESLKNAIIDMEKKSVYFKLLGNYKSHI